MAFINQGKHLEKEIDGVRVRVVEDNASQERVNFLKELLELNGYEVLVEENVPKPKPPPPKPAQGEDEAPLDSTEEEKEQVEQEDPPPTTWTVGVTDIIFNPVVAVYQRMLKTADGKKVTPDYWNQLTDKTEPNYWDLGKKDF